VRTLTNLLFSLYMPQIRVLKMAAGDGDKLIAHNDKISSESSN
jgi:hypothetical protein